MSAVDAAAYARLAERLLAGGVLSDPWLDGRPRFREAPHLLTRDEDARARAAAEAVTALHELVVRACLEDPSLLARYFALTPWQARMWQASRGAWHGQARADVFFTTDGRVQVCELNSDTPSGQAEAVELNAIAHAAQPHLSDPNTQLAPRFCALVEACARPRKHSGPLTVGIVYPTEMVEDLSMIALWRTRLTARGHRVVLGSPYNLHAASGRVALFGAPLDAVVRHYKTDWWSEREPVLIDEPPFADAAPLEGPLQLLLDGDVAVVNPFGAVITQNKRALALLWEEQARFSDEAREAIRTYLPYTARLETISPSELATRERWVLKSDYGCEGNEVIIGAQASEAEWRRAIERARPRRFVVQERFVPRTDGDGIANVGVYTIAGRASGYFTRLSRGATDYEALAAPTLITP